MSRPETVHAAITRTYADCFLVVTFVKRSNGKEREMLCIYDGGGTNETDCVRVHDTEKSAMRAIPMDDVLQILVPSKGVRLTAEDLEAEPPEKPSAVTGDPARDLAYDRRGEMPAERQVF